MIKNLLFSFHKNSSEFFTLNGSLKRTFANLSTTQNNISIIMSAQYKF